MIVETALLGKQHMTCDIEEVVFRRKGLPEGGPAEWLFCTWLRRRAFVRAFIVVWHLARQFTLGTMRFHERK